jgi:LmbE family N-acetylglucosaminyl deacetylase
VKVLLVAAHPDDEVLGAGGTLARHVSEGDAVDVLICAQGLGTAAPRFLDFPDNAMDSVALIEIVRKVEAAVAASAPQVVYTHHPSDLNVDHRLTAQAVLTACRPLPGSAIAAVYAYETVSSTEWGLPDAGAPFAPTHFVDVSATLEQKLRALGAYASEMRPFPHPRSLEAVRHLAAWRGSIVGCAAAEAFVPLRTVRRAGVV